MAQPIRQQPGTESQWSRLGNPDPLRHEIDSGRTGDKVAWPDPAAAPLGTDEEAAGAPLAQSDIDQAMRQETRRLNHPPPREGLGFAWVVVLFAVLSGIAFLIPLLGR